MEIPLHMQPKNTVFYSGTNIKTATNKVVCASYDKPLSRRGEKQKYTIPAAKGLGKQPLRRKRTLEVNISEWQMAWNGSGMFPTAGRTISKAETLRFKYRR
jgi:hypothetical protein